MCRTLNSCTLSCDVHVTPVPSGPETQVLDYQTQQFKLLPLLAQAYGLILTGQYMLRMHLNFNTEISKGNLESLPEVITKLLFY